MNLAEISKSNMRLNTFDIYTIIYLSYLFSGNVSSKRLYMAMIMFVVWVSIAFIMHGLIFNKTIVAMILYTIGVCLYGLIGSNVFFTAKQVGEALLLFSPYFVYRYYCKYKDPNIIKKILIILTVVCLMMCVYSIVIYSESTTTLGRIDVADANERGLIFYGGYSLAYSAVVFFILILGFILNGIIYKPLKIVLSLIILTLFSAMIIKTYSTVVIVIWIVCSIITLLTERKNKKRSLLKILTIILLLIILLLSFSEQIGILLIDNFGNSSDKIAYRLDSIGSFLLGTGSDANYFVFRLSKPLESIDTFIGTPIFGVAYKHGNGYINSFYYGISQHSEWCDVLANYGIIFGVPFLLIYIGVFKEIYQKKTKSEITPICWIAVFLLGLFNPIRGYIINVTIFFIIPSLSYIMQNSMVIQENHYETK